MKCLSNYFNLIENEWLGFAQPNITIIPCVISKLTNKYILFWNSHQMDENN